uniref:Uncharacterized protein n=1 Tax=viral metagenome TaxID=1070528 RepID=A0A6C0J765_9ZZZZ
MAGSFSRNKYDQGAYEQSIKQATNEIQYTLDPVRNDRCGPCRVTEPGFIGKVGVSVSRNRPLVDIESELMSLDIHHTDDPSKKYKPKCIQCGSSNDGVGNTCPKCSQQLNHLPVCAFNTNYTRISNPICTSREIGINRFQPLCLDPQDENRWLHPSEIGISYRMVVKDNHVPCIPVLIDQTPALPTGGGPIPCKNIEANTCGVFIDGLHPHSQMNRNWNN